ncbi:MAG TPA: SGNH/GDSL hydrolase family protein, partial [Polyangiaceae bacterium]|nr:SGNH/GDSL hydrolase family protein [Polyangiaceae bacterium]
MAARTRRSRTRRATTITRPASAAALILAELTLTIGCGSSSPPPKTATQTPAPTQTQTVAPEPSQTATTDAPTPPEPLPPPPPKLVLHLGDSMVGGYGGLTKALAEKFHALGSKFVADWQTSVSIQTFDREHHLQEMLAKHSPDLVILTLGANDVMDPYPMSLASTIRSIARKITASGRTCFWLTPPLWKKDVGAGIIDAIKQNAAPCKVFDGTNLVIARAGDGIHPTDRGGATWADAFFDF